MALKAFDVAAREEIFEIFPELRMDVDAYGNTVRKVLTVKEASVL